MRNNDFIVEMINIKKNFGGVHALKDVSFHCKRGEIHTLVGQNGAGKSTLMKILAGVYPPDEGDIYFEGKKVVFNSPHDAQRLGISIIHQEFNLIPHLTVADNVFLGREPRHKFGITKGRELNQKAEEILTILGVDIDPRIRVVDLSIAQQQMIEIAKALSFNAKLVIMDEPSATLGSKELEKLFNVIKALKKQEIAIIYISHRLEEVFKLADSVTVLRDGELIKSVSIKEIDRTSLVNMMIGSSSFTEQFPQRVKSRKGKPILEVKNLYSEPVLKDINLVVNSGEIVGIAGLMGSGRTELAEVIFGVRRFDRGNLKIMGNDINRANPNKSVKIGLGYVPEDRKNEGLIMKLSVLKNTSLASVHERQRFGFIKYKKEVSEVTKIIKRLNVITPDLEQKVSMLSGGNQQKVVIGKWLLCNPKLIIFDEPTRGIDVKAKIEIWKLIRELAQEGAGVIMISSEIPEVIGVSDRILVMHKGRVAGELSSDVATEEKILTLASFGG